MSVGVARGTSWAATTPTLVVKEGYYHDPRLAISGRTYDICPDGQRFLMVKGGGAGADAPRPRASSSCSTGARN